MKLTCEDYLLLPDDGLRHEWLDGEHYVTPSPSVKGLRLPLRDIFRTQSGRLRSA